MKKILTKLTKLLVLIFIIVYPTLLTSCKNEVNIISPDISISEDGYYVVNGEKTNQKISTKEFSLQEIFDTMVNNGYSGSFSEFIDTYIKNDVLVKTPSITISNDGYWIIDGKKTTIKAHIEIDSNNLSVKDIYETMKYYGYSGTFYQFVDTYISNGTTNTSNIINECKQSIVSVKNVNNNKIIGSGTVIKINNDVFILTNYHVCYPNNGTFLVYKADDEEYSTPITITYINGDEDMDLAILKVQNTNDADNLNPAIIANCNAKAGEICYAIGNTHTKGIAISIGTISKDLENINYYAGASNKQHTVLRHCAYISTGNSGGGLFNIYGELIGITCAGEGDDETLINYAIPISIINEFLNEN